MIEAYEREKKILMAFIDGVANGEINREQISKRVDMFSIVILHRQLKPSKN